jgi:hypothetical protein
VPESPVVPAVRVALAVLESPAVLVALAVLENPVVLVALAVLEKPVARAVQVRQLLAALARQLAAALVNQVEVAAKAVQTRSVDISRRGVAAVAPSLAAVGALLKPRAAGVAAA